jgi:signal transduction histidine kinase
VTLDLRRLRLACLAFGCVNSLVLILILLRNPSTIRMAVLGTTSLVALCAYWAYGFRRGFLWPLDILEAGALLLAGLAAGDAEHALGVVYAANFFRSLYDSPRRVVIRSLMFYVALAAALSFTSSPLGNSDRIPHLIGILFTAFLAQLVSKTLIRNERAVHRERTLRTLGGDLVGTQDPESAYAAVAAALLALGESDHSVRASVILIAQRDITIVACVGDRASDLLGQTFHSTERPGGEFDDLPIGQPAVQHTPPDATAADGGMLPGKQHHVSIAIRVGRDLRGIAVYASDLEVPEDLQNVLGTLGTQISAWLAQHEAIQAARDADDLRAELLKHLVVAQEDERKLIAGDIHDDSIQLLTSAGIRLGILRKYITDDRGTDALDKAADAVATSISSLRRLMFNLRPPAIDSEGLTAALLEHLAATAEDCGFRGEVHSSASNDLPSEVSVTAFRIVQEALANVRKHANAKHVQIDVADHEGGVLVSVRDDGAGFSIDPLHPSARGHLGMTSMRERAELAGGWFTVSSEIDHGTVVRFLVPGQVVHEPLKAA